MRNVTAKDLMDRTRNIIKGVRMNKRAALMLQNRNIDEEDQIKSQISCSVKYICIL